MTGIPLLITFTAAVIIMIIAISKWKVHPFLAIMGIALLLAITVGIPLKDIPGTLGSGFSGIFTSIGIVIILGALIGSMLEKTGAAIKLADMTVKLVGKKNPELAIMIMGWVVSIPVFCDSGFVILNPIRAAIRQRTKASSVAMTVALSAGLYVSHVFIPPTPGPIAAAGSVGMGGNLLMIMGFGALVSIPCLIAAYLYAKFIGKKVKSDEDLETDGTVKSYDDLLQSFGKLPNGLASLAPILVPILCMSLGSISSVLKWQGSLAMISTFIGSPVIALTIGVIFGVILLSACKKMPEFSDMTNETLKVVGPILFITAAGGVLGRVITQAGFVDYIKANSASLAAIGIFFPFFISAILKTAQGSSTVAIVTAAAIMGSYSDPKSMMSALALTTPVAAALTVMAIAAGGMTVSHANDSYFWVVTNFGKMKAQDGYKTQTAVTLVMGLTAIIFVWILSLFLI